MATKAKPPAAPAKKPPLKPLSITERTFLEHYIASGFSGAEACRRMGVKGKEGGKDDSNPRVRAYEFLQRTHVQQHLEIMRAKLPSRFPNLLEKAMRTYDNILEFDRRDVVDEHDQFVGIKSLTFEQASCIRKLKFRKGRIDEIEFESHKAAADAVIDRLHPQADKADSTGGAPMPAMVVINVQGQPLQQSFKVLSLEEQGIKEDGH